jgi:hypothetical protein
MAALRLRSDPSPWLGAKKGGQIAAAAIGAAVVDTFVARRAPSMRKGGLRHAVAKQAAQMVIGGLVGGGRGRDGGGGGGGGGGRKKKGGLGVMAGGRGKGGGGRRY